MAAMRIMRYGVAMLAMAVLAGVLSGQAQSSTVTDRPDPKEIPLPPIKTSMPDMPGVDQLPNRPEMPDPLTLNNGQKVKTAEQWDERREQMKRVLEYYAVGQAPPPPGNVKGTEVSSQTLADGKVKYRLVHLTFGPNESLSLDIGIFTPAQGGPFPTLISPSGSPPGATPLPHLAQGANQGHNEDVLLVVGPASPTPRALHFRVPAEVHLALQRAGLAVRPVPTLRGALSHRALPSRLPRRIRLSRTASLSSPSITTTAAKTQRCACPTEAGPTAPRVFSLPIPTTIGACCARGHGAPPASSTISSPILRSTRTS